MKGYKFTFNIVYNIINNTIATASFTMYNLFEWPICSVVLGNKLCARRMSYFEWFSENIKAVSNKSDLCLSTFLFLKATEMYKMV